MSPRLRVLDAEIQRIGTITVLYRRTSQEIQTESGAVKDIEEVTEEREAFFVSQGSSLEKLIQAYIAQGGNPMAISLFLQPDETQFTSEENPNEDSKDNPNEMFTAQGPESTPADQPSRGVVAPLSGDYGVGGRYIGGMSSLQSDVFRVVGRYFSQGQAGAKISVRMNHAKEWVQQEIAALTKLETRIIKLMDLREQLITERNTIIFQAVGGSVPDYPIPPSTERFARNLHLTAIVSDLDRVFYKTSPDGEIEYDAPNLRRDENSGINNVTPSGMSFYDTLLPDEEGIDPFT